MLRNWYLERQVNGVQYGEDNRSSCSVTLGKINSFIVLFDLKCARLQQQMVKYLTLIAQLHDISKAGHVFFYSESTPYVGSSLLQLSRFCVKHGILLLITPI
jgi:hypothetical protein